VTSSPPTARNGRRQTIQRGSRSRLSKWTGSCTAGSASVIICPSTSYFYKMNKQKSAMRGRNRQNKRKVANPQEVARPPQLNSNVMFSHTFRFLQGGGSSPAITVGNLLGIAGAVGTVTNTTVNAICDSVRLNWVKVWTPPASQGASATCSLEWTPSSFAPTTEVSDTTMSVATPAHIVARPPRGSQAAFWNSAGASANTLFTITPPAGSVIDVNATYVLADKTSATLAFSVATAALGKLYYLALDQTVGSNLVPVSLTTTT